MYTQTPPTYNHSKYQNKEEYTPTIILNIKRDKNTGTQKEKKIRKKKYKEKPHQFCTSK